MRPRLHVLCQEDARRQSGSRLGASVGCPLATPARRPRSASSARSLTSRTRPAGPWSRFDSRRSSGTGRRPSRSSNSSASKSDIRRKRSELRSWSTQRSGPSEASSRFSAYPERGRGRSPNRPPRTEPRSRASGRTADAPGFTTMVRPASSSLRRRSTRSSSVPHSDLGAVSKRRSAVEAAPVQPRAVARPASSRVAVPFSADTTMLAWRRGRGVVEPNGVSGRPPDRDVLRKRHARPVGQD